MGVGIWARCEAQHLGIAKLHWEIGSFELILYSQGYLDHQHLLKHGLFHYPFAPDNYFTNF